MNIRKRLQSIMENDLVHQGEISMDRIEWTQEKVKSVLMKPIIYPPRDAKRMLDSGPNGILNHPILENTAFIFLTNSGEYGFYTGDHDPEVEPWNWSSDVRALDGWDDYDIYNDWIYIPGTHVRENPGGHELWQALKIPHSTKRFNKAALIP